MESGYIGGDETLGMDYAILKGPGLIPASVNYEQV